jgi:hypothetical protein
MHRHDVDHGTRGADDRTADLTSHMSKPAPVVKRSDHFSNMNPEKPISPASDG